MDWKPIETAPRDGTPVILALKTDPCRVVGGACWNQEADHPWIISDDRRYGHAGLFAVADHHVIAWAPMPSPPNADLTGNQKPGKESSNVQ